MVGPLFLLKMLHCKRVNRKSNVHRAPKEISREDNVQEYTVKIEDNNDLFRVCRVCLKEGNIPIYGNNIIDNTSDALYTFGGIEVRIDDAYPKALCQSCYALLQGAILFRKTAQESDDLLKQPPPEETLPVENEDNDENDIIDGTDTDNDTSFGDEQKHTKYHCKKCDLEFETLKQYREHKLSEDHDNRRIMCSICNNSYNAGYYKKHLALHKLEPHYMCDVCGKKFIIQGQFTRHRLTHFYKLPFKCSLCPYRGRFTESLKMHMRSHTGEKPYQCAQCSARFINKSNLNKHMLTHRSEHDFKCESCDRGFYTRRDLDLHFKVDHTGIKDHICNVCGKAFGYRKQMMKHQLKVHKREKLRSGRMPLYLKVETMKKKGEHIEEN